jgi:CRISPR-associated protein Csx17
MSNKSIYVHKLTGCSPSPLAHYLKALGILRLVSEQVDSDSRGWWRHDAFFLATLLDRDQLENFFLKTYSPTPMISPWNGGSGFYPKDNKSGIEPIEQSKSHRFRAYREAISVAGQRNCQK